MLVGSTKTNAEPSQKSSLQNFSWLVIFAATGLDPVSTALAGVLIGLNMTVLLVCSGILMAVFTLFAAFSRAVRAGLE